MEESEKKELKEKFKVICNQCGQEADLSFYAGFIHDCGGDTGSLSIECPACLEDFMATVDV